MALPFSDTASAQNVPRVKQDTKTNEQDVITQMGKDGYKNFLLLNKKNSSLYIIQDGEVFLETPVIIGRNRGQKSLTPSGVFSLTNIFQGATQPEMMFYIDQSGGYLLHDVVRGREYAFQADSVTAKRLSDGCVNIPSVILPYILGFARQRAIEHPDHLATPLVIMEENYSAPQFTKRLEAFKPQKYNPD